MPLQGEDFQQEIAAAARSYDKFVVCVEKTPDQFLKSLQSLMNKAINAFENRAPGLRHGIALDRHCPYARVPQVVEIHARNHAIQFG